jgi:hypothetical protein
VKKRYIIIFAAVFVLAVAAVFFARATTTYGMQVAVVAKGSSIGIAPFTDRVDFGDVPQGSNISKTITLDNNGDNDNPIKIYMTGSIGSFIEIEPGSSFTLPAGQSQDITLKITIPESAAVGDKFTGRILILQLP